MVDFVSFWKLKVCGQTVLPDRSILIGQKLLEMLNETFLWFSTIVMCITVWLILESVWQLKLINAVQFVTIINVSNAFTTLPQCLEIIEKVAFKIASEAS